MLLQGIESGLPAAALDALASSWRKGVFLYHSSSRAIEILSVLVTGMRHCRVSQVVAVAGVVQAVAKMASQNQLLSMLRHHGAELRLLICDRLVIVAALDRALESTTL